MDQKGTVSGKMDSVVNTASIIEFGQGGALYAKSVDNKNGGITLKRVAVGEKEHVKNEVAPSGSIKRYQLSEERIYGHDDEIPKDKVVVHSSENLQLSVYGDHKDSWTKYEYDRTREKDVVDTSNPGRIISGGNLHMDVDHMTNEASQISAAGDITGTVGHYEQSNPKGNEYITEDGIATSYSRHHKKGWDTTNIREAKYKNTKVNPKDVPVAVYGSHVEHSTSDAAVDTSLLHSMSQLSTNPNTTYVIETDPNFTNRRNFLSSDYVLSRLKLDPMNVQKRLGDGYYEQQLVMQEIMRQTGKSRLQSGLSAEEQYRQLMDAGISVTKSQSIALGRGLTETEQKNLKEDVVLLVSKAVVLPNGKTETVLVPTLYLAPTTKRVEGAANLQAQSINLSVDTMKNSGSIVADKDVTLTGNTIHNDNGLIKGNTTKVTANDEVRNTQGTIMGNDTVSVYAKKDVINEGGTITQTNAAGSTKVSAGRDVINTGVQYEAANSKVEWDSRNNRRETITGVDQGRIGGAGETTVVAGRDVSMAAGIITSDVNTHVAAGHNVTMKAMNATHELEEHRFDKGKSGGGHSQTTQSHDLVNAQSSVGSSIEGKNISVVASDAVQLEGSQLLAADTVKVSGDTVELNTAKANSTVNHVYLDKKKSFVKRESTNAVDDVTTTAVTGSTVSGKDIQLTSGHDVIGQSAQIIGEHTVGVTAGGKVELGADKVITDGTSVYRHKKSGLLGGVGIGFSIGKEKHNIDEANHEESTVRNTIASTKGAVSIKANDTVHITSADIVAKEGAVLEGSAVTLDGNVDHNHMSHDERYKKTGLTVSLGGAVANTLTNATRTIKQAGGRDDKRLAALELNEARQQLQDGYAAVDKAVKGVKLRDTDGKVLKDAKNHSRRGQKNIDDAVNLSVSIGSTSRKQGQVVDTNTYQGGALASDSTVHITARDAKDSGINITGETVQAKNLVLDSASDINLAAGKNTVDVKNTYKSSGWSVGAGISLTSGGLLDINASGNMARQNGDTNQESYVPTTIKAAQLAQLKAKRDTTIVGSTVSGKKVEVDTGRDLHMQSLQDIDNFKEHSKSAGFSVSSKPNFKDPTGSISASVGRIDSKWKSVTHQAGIYAGEDGYDIHVGNGTTLEGAVIKSEAPKAKNTLTTKSLEMKDIQNEAEYTYSNNGIGYNYYGSKKKLEEMKANDKKGYDKIYNSIGLVPNLGVGSKGKASSTTQSAISDGILTLDGKEIDTKTINTNTENTLHQLDKIFDKKKIEERQELARLFAKNAYEQLHNWQPTTKEGKIAKAFAHGVIGEWAARMAGNAPGSGFKATMTNELLIEKIKQIADNDPALAQWLSAAVGGVVNKVSGDSVNTGAAVASYATKWNEFQNEPELFNQLNEIKKNNYIVSMDGESFDLRSMKNGAYYVISVKDKITNKYKSIAIDNKLQMFDIVYEDGGTTSGLTGYYFSILDIGKSYEPETYKKLDLVNSNSNLQSLGKKRKFEITDYDGSLNSPIDESKVLKNRLLKYWYSTKNFFSGLFNKNQYGKDSLTAGYRRALQGKSYGYTPEWNWETGEYSIMGNPIVESILSDSEVLNAQKIGISKHAEDIDLNGRGFGGKSILRGFIKREPSKQFLNRITDGTHMEVVDGIKVLKPSIVYLKNGYTYYTDADRNITKVSGIIELNDAKRIPSAQKAIVQQTGIPGEDQGGHLIAKIFNGSGDIDNLVAMDRVVNQSEYRRVENAIKKAVMEGNVVSVEIEVIRNGSKRPSGFKFSYSVNGEPTAKYNISN